MKNNFVALLCGLLLLLGQSAIAQTPDGETPANEGVCDSLIGMTPGLYGLCVAFCEAQDAEATFDPSTGELIFAEGNKPSNPKLLQIYNNKKTPDDPPMPCVNIVATECPCWTEAELDAVAGDTIFTDICIISDTTLLAGADPASGSVEYAFAGQDSCGFSDFDGIVFHNRLFAITEAEASTCRQSVIAECNSRGIPSQ